MRQLLLALGVAVLMAGCASSVKLDDVPVEDRTGAAVTTPVQDGNGQGSGVNSGGVAAVDLGKNKQDMASLPGEKVIYFDYDSFIIKPEYQAIVEANARFVKANKTRKLAIEGHTDERGGREYNLALGQKRAEAIRSALSLLGVDDAQMEAVSFGKEKPAATGNNEASFAKNRRAELSYR